MANYVPHFTKKQERLEWREEKLRRSIMRDDEHEVQLGLAEEVRLARIRALKEKCARFAPTANQRTACVEGFGQQIALLETVLAQDILAECRAHCQK